jgi:hypothetical protein
MEPTTLTTEELYRLVLPAVGHYCLWNRAAGFRWFTSIEEMAAFDVGSAADWYYATTAFERVCKREKEHATVRRCFHLDIDAGCTTCTHGSEGACWHNRHASPLQRCGWLNRCLDSSQ